MDIAGFSRFRFQEYFYGGFIIIFSRLLQGVSVAAIASQIRRPAFPARCVPGIKGRAADFLQAKTTYVGNDVPPATTFKETDRFDSIARHLHYLCRKCTGLIRG
ncbi:hypothetical protein GCM10010321_78810 [Streptomyces chartreusis]|nr:hypothetical protein GCM10010321_78810 [Streptomyces chartreusis]